MAQKNKKNHVDRQRRVDGKDIRDSSQSALERYVKARLDCIEI